MTLNPMTSYNSLNLMDVWNEARQLTSFSSNSKPLFVDKFNQIKHQLERIPNVSKLTQQIIYTAFKKAISDDSDWYNQLHTIQIYTRELLLRGIVNDLDFHQFTLDSLIDLTMESDYIAEDIIEKFKNHPAITKITQEDFVQQLIRAVKEERYTFVNYWTLFVSMEYRDFPEIKKIIYTMIKQINELIYANASLEEISKKIPAVWFLDPSCTFASVFVSLIENNRSDLLKWLYERGMIDLFETLRYEDKVYTPLHFAADKGRLKFVQYLIEQCNVPCSSIFNKAFNLNPKALRLYSPLCLAIKKGHFEVAKYLIENKAWDPLNEYLYLASAIISCNYEMVKLIIDQISPPKEWDDEWIFNLRTKFYSGEVSQIIGSYDHHVELYKEFAKKVFKARDKRVISILSQFESAKISCSTLHNHLAELIDELMQAELYDEVKGLQCFREFNIEYINKSAEKKFASLFSKAQTQKATELISAFPDCKDEIFKCAAKYGTVDDLKYCIEVLNCDPKKNINDASVLAYAIVGEKFENIKFLVETCKVNVNPANIDDYWSIDIKIIINTHEQEKIKKFPLTTAAIVKNCVIAKYLIENGAIITEYVLLASIMLEHFEMLKLFLDRGLKFSSFSDGKGQSWSFAAKFALINGSHIEIVKLLLNRGASISPHYSIIFACRGGNLAQVKYFCEELRHHVPKEDYMFEDLIEAGHADIMKYLVDNYHIPLKNWLANLLESNQPMWWSGGRMRNLFTKAFEQERKNKMAMFRYLFGELKAYPSLEQLAFHLKHAPDCLYEKTYLISLISQDAQEQKDFKLLSEMKSDLLDGETLKRMSRNNYFSHHGRYRVRKIRRQQIARDYLIRIFSCAQPALPVDISRYIADSIDLVYPFLYRLYKKIFA